MSSMKDIARLSLLGKYFSSEKKCVKEFISGAFCRFMPKKKGL